MSIQKCQPLQLNAQRLKGQVIAPQNNMYCESRQYFRIFPVTQLIGSACKFAELNSGKEHLTMAY